MADPITENTPANCPAEDIVLAALRNRRSIRAWQKQPVPRETLTRLLEAAIWAPSADNLQPWRFIVLQGERQQELGALLRRFVDEMQPGLNPLLWVHRAGLLRSVKRIQSAGAIITAWAIWSPDDVRLRVAARGDLTPLFSWTMVVQSVAAATQNLLLAAHACGLGAVWLGYPNLAGPQIKAWLQADGELMATVALGYPAAARGSGRRKPLQDVVRWEG